MELFKRSKDSVVNELNREYDVKETKKIFESLSPEGKLEFIDSELDDIIGMVQDMVKDEKEYNFQITGVRE